MQANLCHAPSSATSPGALSAARRCRGGVVIVGPRLRRWFRARKDLDRILAANLVGGFDRVVQGLQIRVFSNLDEVRGHGGQVGHAQRVDLFLMLFIELGVFAQAWAIRRASRRPKNCKKLSVVPYSSGRPTSSFLPKMRIKSRSSKFFNAPRQCRRRESPRPRVSYRAVGTR